MAALRAWLSRGRTRALVAITATIVLVAGVALVTTRGDNDDGTALVAIGPDDASSTASTTSSSSTTSSTIALEPVSTTTATTPPTTAPPPPPATVAPAPAPAAGEPVTVATDPAGAWTLVRYDTSSGACLELRVQTFRSERVLCGAAPAATGKVVGDLITFNTPVGRAIVAIVEPRVEAWGPMGYQQQHVAAFKDPSPGRSAYAYAVNANRMIGTAGSMQLFFSIGENVIARTSFAVGDKAVPPGQSLTTTDKPYGIWPGYRRAGTTGFYYGGNEEFGFYDGADGGRCVLFRRLGGDPEAMLFDLCAPRSTDRPVAAAKIIPAGPPYANPMLVVLADGLQVVRWTCTTSSGTSCGATAPSPTGHFGRESQLTADPAGSGRQLLGSFPGWTADLAGAKDVTVTLFAAGDQQVGKVTIPVP
jgi:hypothetical protein